MPSARPTRSASKAHGASKGLDQSTLDRVINALDTQGQILLLEDALSECEARLAKAEEENEKLRNKLARVEWDKKMDEARKANTERILKTAWAIRQFSDNLHEELVAAGQYAGLGGPSELQPISRTAGAVAHDVARAIGGEDEGDPFGTRDPVAEMLDAAQPGSASPAWSNCGPATPI